MRITGGTHRSRRLRAPGGRATRPTSDRVREALFGILGSAGAIEGARVLDLYAGTGALGLEALSRGASHVTFVESARDALTALRENVGALGFADRTRVVAASVDASLRTVGTLGKGAPYDLVLVDPPWSLVESGEVPRSLACVAAAGILSARALLVLEHSARTAPPDIGLLARKDWRRYGDTALAFYNFAILPPQSPA